MGTPKKNTLSIISQELKDFNFNNFNPVKDKPKLMETITIIKSRLGKLLRDMEK